MREVEGWPLWLRYDCGCVAAALPSSSEQTPAMRWTFDSEPSALFACSNIRMCARWNRSNTPSQYLTQLNATQRQQRVSSRLVRTGEAGPSVL